MTSERLQCPSMSIITATRVLANVLGNCTRPIDSSDMVYSSPTYLIKMLNCSFLLTSVASSAIIAYHDGLGDFTLLSIHPSTSCPIMFISSLTMLCDTCFSSFSHAWMVSLSLVLSFKSWLKFPSSSEWLLITRPSLKRKHNEVICFKRPARQVACRFASWDEIMTCCPWAVFLKDNFITASLRAWDASSRLVNFSNDFFQLWKLHLHIC